MYYKLLLVIRDTYCEIFQAYFVVIPFMALSSVFDVKLCKSKENSRSYGPFKKMVAKWQNLHVAHFLISLQFFEEAIL